MVQPSLVLPQLTSKCRLIPSPAPRAPRLRSPSPCAALTPGALHLQFPLPGSFPLPLLSGAFLSMRSQGRSHFP